MRLQDAGEAEREVFLGFLEESAESLDTLDSLFVQLEQQPNNPDVINSIFRPVHSLKGNSPFFGLLKLKTLAHELESLLVQIRNGKCAVTSQITSHLLLGTDVLKAMVASVRNGGEEVTDEAQYESLLVATRVLLDAPPEATPVVSSPPVPTPAPEHPENTAQESQKRSVQTDSMKFMRIAEERIDTFLTFVGEFVVVGETLRHLNSRLSVEPIQQSLQRDFSELQSVFARQLSGLEHSIMSIRKVSIKNLLQKAPRLIRDVAVAKGKDIRVEIEGEDIEVDKSLVELLDSPLTHMARNAADHGVEAPEVRLAGGKSTQGRIVIKCEEREQTIAISVTDDGAGLNYPALQAKAESLGLISPGSALGQDDVIKLLFMAGVSTAKEVSDISGRGVGMDVVKRAIEDAGGSISVTSEQGKGTSFEIVLKKSVTTQIVQGFVISVDNTCFLLPMTRVKESWAIANQSFIEVCGKERRTLRHGKTHRVVSLREILGIREESNPDVGKLAVTLELEDREDVVVLVDNIVGLKQLVIRELDEMINTAHMYRGIAVMGDGGLALALDLQAMTDRLRESKHMSTH